MKILLVDDDIDFAIAISHSVRSWGHDVTVVHNWLTVMTKLKKEEYDLILADVETPTGNGLDAFGFLNMDPNVAGIPKIFVTGRDDPETRRRCFELDAKYVSKSSRVLETLRPMLESRSNELAMCQS